MPSGPCAIFADFFCKSELFPSKNTFQAAKKLRVHGHGAFYVAKSLAYFSSTLPPASSICFFRASASSLLTAFLQSGGSALDGSLGLSQALAGDLADNLDDLDLGSGVKASQNHVETRSSPQQREQQRQQREQP